MGAETDFKRNFEIHEHRRTSRKKPRKKWKMKYERGRNKY